MNVRTSLGLAKARRAAARGVLLCGLLAAPRVVHAQQDPLPVMQNPSGDPALIKQIGLDQKLDAQVPLDLNFKDEKGQTVTLGQYFGKRPVILALVYYECPMLCTFVLNGVLNSTKAMVFDMGKEYDVVTVSIDPSETPLLAEAKHTMYAGLYGRPGAVTNWHFLTGREPAIKKLADAVGFRYVYDKTSQQYGHASGIMVLTPQGRVSRYFYGIDYAPRDLRLAIVEASGGKVGSPVDQILLACFHYDPMTGKYGLVISRVVRFAGAATVLAIGAMMMIFFRGERYGLPKDEKNKRGRA